MRTRLVIAGFAVLALLVAACAGDNEEPATTDTSATNPPEERTAAPPDPQDPTPAASATTTTLAPSPEPTPSAPTTTSTPAPSPEGLVLKGDGIGIARFGDDPDKTIAAVTAILGEPDYDTGWGDPSDEANDALWGCPGTIGRVVGWPPQITLRFSNWAAALDPDVPAWPSSEGLDATYLPAPLFAGVSGEATSDGARRGDTLGEMRAIYGDRLYVSDSPDDYLGWYWFAIDGDTHPWARSGGLRGWLFGPEYPSGPAAPGSPTDDWVNSGFTAGMSCGTP